MQSAASIEDQVRVCTAQLERDGWSVVETYPDYAITGATALRPGYQALLSDARAGRFEMVIAESLDRFSRDQEHIAGFYKLMSFAGIAVMTLAEGTISELHIGLKGTMSALYLKDLAQKTHRGLEGRVRSGASAGGNAYGYRVTRRLDANGQPVTGEREIQMVESAVVRRIFESYAAGESPKRIALKLNGENIPGPRGGAWTASTINGNRTRGTGILNNELYMGRLTWNRLAYVKDPETGRRRSRRRASSELVVTELPHSRIIPDELWNAVKARQAELDRRRPDLSSGPAPFWAQHRPRYLFSGLMHCGICGGGFSKISAQHFGCSTARNKGPTVCTNVRTIRRDRLEDTVLSALRERLMEPDLFRVFAEEFTAEWNRLQSAASADQKNRTAELQKLTQQIERLVDAIAEGTPSAAVRGRLSTLEQRKLELESTVSSQPSPAPRLHPNLAYVYRAKVASLADALSKDDAAEARELVRKLVERITLMPDQDGLRVEVRGDLAAILHMAQGRGHASNIGNDTDALAVQIKMVAGACNRRSHRCRSRGAALPSGPMGDPSGCLGDRQRSSRHRRQQAYKNRPRPAVHAKADARLGDEFGRRLLPVTLADQSPTRNDMPRPSDVVIDHGLLGAPIGS
jgi:DNA invertase Pin-like site-specific DNA recombinase